jgi:hypothetical protein
MIIVTASSPVTGRRSESTLKVMILLCKSQTTAGSIR